jgi:hypothetical protein
VVFTTFACRGPQLKRPAIMTAYEIQGGLDAVRLAEIVRTFVI